MQAKVKIVSPTANVSGKASRRGNLSTEGPGGSVGCTLLKDQADKDLVEDDKDEDEVETGEVDKVVGDATGGLYVVCGPLEQTASQDVRDDHGEDSQQGQGLDKRHQII